MQSSMWIVLAATVGMAVGVDRFRAAIAIPHISADDYTDGVISLRLPLGWKIEQRLLNQDPRIVCTIVEPTQGNDVRGRAIRLFRQEMDPNTNVADFLIHHDYLNQLFARRDFSESTRGKVPAVLGEDGTIAFRFESRAPDSKAELTLWRDKMALFALFPNGQAITLTISRLGRLEIGDIRLLDTVASTITFSTSTTDSR